MSNNKFEPPEFLADVRKLQDEIDELQKRLELVENNREKVRQKIYEKVKGDYEKKLSDLFGELKPFQEKIEFEIATLEEEIEKHQEVVDSNQEHLEEYQLRFFAGEFAEEDFEPLQKEIEQKIEDSKQHIIRVNGQIHEYNKHLSFITGEPLKDMEPPLDEDLQEALDDEVMDEPGEGVPMNEPHAESGIESGIESIDMERVEEDDGIEDYSEPAAEMDLEEDSDEIEMETGVSDYSEFNLDENAADHPIIGSTEEGHPLMKDTVDSDILADQGFAIGEEAIEVEDENEDFEWGNPPVLDVVDGDFTGESYTIDKERITMGRGPNNDIQLATDTSVSRHHAQIALEGTKYVLVDLESSNGTSVNGIRISRAVLKPNDEIMIGQSKLIIRTQE